MMNLSASELINAKEATAELLDQLGIGNYMFEVEPGEGPWEVHVECERGGAWQTLAIQVDRGKLLASRSSQGERNALLADWRERFAAVGRR